ncbi:DsbA family protein [Patescibacteria group bacterium]|nr:DsbA family protein [Patescibacteria group bacterium]
MAAKKLANYLERFIPILLVASIGLAFVVGILWQKVSSLEGGGATRTTAQTSGAGETQPQRPSSGKLSDAQVEKIPKVSSEDHIKGNRDAKVFLIEYSDLECPFCKRFHPTVQQVIDEYGGDVAWVWRHFPLDQIHSKADKEAEAVECAGELGGDDAFWALVDKIFEVTPSNNALSLDDLPGLAGEIGLNQGAFQSCLDSGKYADHVEEDYQGGITAGVTGTPGNFIVNSSGDAWLIPGALPYEQIKLTIDEALGG